MSEYNKTNMYFIKLYDSFVNSDEIRWVESQEHGAEIVLMFLRLMIVAKNKEDGKLARIVGKMITPYDINEMASVTFQTEERVIEGLEILQKAELVVKKDDCYTIPKALEFTNQTTVGALKKQVERKRKADKMDDNCLTDIEEEKEKEERIKKKEKEGETYIKEIDGFPYGEIIEYLNNKVGSNYRTDSKGIIKLINQRLEEGFTKEDFFIVIDKKHKEWNGTEYSKYLRPKTLFGDKFESYVNQPEPIKSKYDGFNWNSLIANSDDMEF